jgi:hypothetical protein
MALITSAATGNFSSGATWTGGVVPTVGDEARASTGHTITIDVDTTCDEVSNAGTGIFTLASGVTLTANVTSKSTTTSRNCLQFTAASPAVGYIVGNCTGGTVASAAAAANTSSGTLNITGNCLATNQFSYGANNASTGTLNITGNCTGGGLNQQAYGANNASTGTLNITGNCTGGSNPSGSGSFGAFNNSTGTINLTGNTTGGSGSNGAGISNASTGTITITGISTGGTVASASGVNNASTGTVNLTRAKGTAYGPGNTSGLAAAVGASNAGLGVIEIQELEYGEYGMSPTSGTGIKLKKLGSNVAVFNYVDAGAAKTLVDATTGQMPAATDVRDGVSYASGALTGTCAVPAAASVAFGVPVDATTGTAALTPAAVWEYATREITGGVVDTLTNAPASVTPSDIWSHASRTITGGTVDTLTNAPTVPSAASIRAEIDSNSTQLAAIKSKTDALPVSPAATGDIPTADITAIKGKTDLLNTDRLAQVSTVSTTGAQLAAALS